MEGSVLIATGTSRFVDGIYGRTRNPLYLGATLVYLGLSVAAGSLWAIVLVVPLLWVINVGWERRPRETLRHCFGRRLSVRTGSSDPGVLSRALAVCGLVLIAMGTSRFVAAGTNIPPNLGEREIRSIWGRPLSTWP